jgi:hypothetical protein
MRKSCSPTRTNPKLWEKVKQTVKRSPKGGKPNTWSARKAQLAVALYKKKGGSYRGSKRKCNSLTKWSEEDWGYIKGKSGRYLPKAVRDHLTPAEKKRENALKGDKKGKRVPYSPSVLRKVRKYRK